MGSVRFWGQEACGRVVGWGGAGSAGTRRRTLGGEHGRTGTPVKAFSRRRRWPQASLDWAACSATIGPPSLTVDGHRRPGPFFAICGAALIGLIPGTPDRTRWRTAPG